jgi:fructan beta-fructosidase
MKRIIYYFGAVLMLFSVLIWSCNTTDNKSLSGENTSVAYYHEKYRPQFHFSPRSGWMNDPNGLVFLDGEYHLFYQYYPDSTVWGPMHWGHAVSNDLVRWYHLPVALYPDSMGYIFSGSAVVDNNNTAGFADNSNPSIVAIFTYHNPILARNGSSSYQSQGIAYSTDKGRTWTKYSGNPVLPNPGKIDFRDPKVFRHERTGKWIMILAVKDRVHIYSSPDLKSWSFESEFGEKAGAHGGVWECPDLFPIKVQENDSIKWVMLVSINPGGPNGGSDTQYFTGDFDGHVFNPDNIKEKWVDLGTDNYAGVTWSGIPENDGRRIFIGWMSNWDYATVVPTSVWRSAMTIPREFYLISENNEYTLISKPLKEFSSLMDGNRSVKYEAIECTGTREIPLGFKLNQSELSFEFRFEGPRPDTFGIILENSVGEKFIIGYSVSTQQVFIDRRNAGISSFSERFAGIARASYLAGNILTMRLFIDSASSELFIDDGKLVMTTLFFPTEHYSKLSVFSTGGKILLENTEFREIESIWSIISD